jgi:shikimate dehydrogenase
MRPTSGDPSDSTFPTDPAERQLAERREEIDRLDDQILELFHRRLAAASGIGAIKAASGRGVADPGREAQVLARLLAQNRGAPLAGRALLRIYFELFQASRAVQERVPGAAAGDPPPLHLLFGDPVGHSASPAMHRAAFAAAGLPGLYAAVRTDDIRRAVQGMRALGIRGASVTLPHKEAVLGCLDRLDPAAARIGAVNTLLNTGEAIHGFNTDCEGAVQALNEKTQLAGKRVAVLGAGGAARAVVYGVLRAGGHPTVFNRSAAHAERLAADLGADCAPLSDFGAGSFDILVNTTPVGMTPYPGATPIPADRLAGHLVVMDIVYTPLRTRLLAAAEAAGCAVVDGLSMFVHQGARQFELWTGRPAPVAVMRLAAAAELEAQDRHA